MQTFKQFKESFILNNTIDKSLDSHNLQIISSNLNSLINNFYSDVLKQVKELPEAKEYIKFIIQNAAAKIGRVMRKTGADLKNVISVPEEEPLSVFNNKGIN